MTTSSRPGGATGPHRKAPPSRLRRASEVVLAVGSVLAVLAAFGPAWLARVGVAVAVAAAVVGCVCAWRELFCAERRHARATLAAAQRHGAQLRQERTRNAGVVAALGERLEQTRGEVAGLQVVVSGLRHELFALEGDRTRLRGDLAARDRTIASLRGTVRDQQSELDRLRTEQAQEEASVHALPRRAELREELELASGEAPVLDLRTLETIPAVLPNYEADRRWA